MRWIKIFHPKNIIRRIKRKKLHYLVDGKYLKVMKSGRLAIVYYDFKCIFNNLLSGESFDIWWKDFKVSYKNCSWEKLRKKKWKKIEEKFIAKKYLKQKKYEKRKDQNTHRNKF
jgi:hypothetical protein